ncbi:YafY family protein [uncultured Slackia sp.]|uniref:helix-turn-helix transcriptional regulator n=1 Tax=uncultured Slackia sp. TaxID=665903 RepID=UPI0026DEE13D|nr:HTH domain-containing protein [uncultured Slackia sp.]
MQSRLVGMTLFLVGRGRATISELAERFEVSKKTVERDILRLSSAGIPVHCERGCKGGVFIDPSYRIERGSFDGEEIGDIVLALHLLESVGGKGRGRSVLEKLSALIPELAYVKKLEFDEYLHIELLDADLGTDDAVFVRINMALEDETYLECVISDDVMVAAPLSYVLRPSGLFLYCCAGGRDYRLIPLCAIDDCAVLPVEFDRVEYAPYPKGLIKG